ncbi:MAG: methyltransferase [Alphaproteobacteria bacterium]|nr:methyltransferase [Alphaproteobacteria bacterium]
MTVGLAYLAPMTARPYNYMFEPPPGTAWQNCEYRLHRVAVADARAIGSRPDVDVEGFELCAAPSSVTDFRDEGAIRRQYYGEAAELAKHVTGADHAYVFDHQVRQREAGRPALTFGRTGDGSRPGAAGRIHNDYTEASGHRPFGLVDMDDAVRAGTRRFAIVNVWRSIAGKVLDTPLALCDARTVPPDDLVAADLVYPNRRGELYLMRHSPHHRWVYFPEMDIEEALVFKQYDSLVNGVARFTPHTAFDLPHVPLDAPLRQSIEIRCLVTYN